MSKRRDFPVWQRNYFDHVVRNEKSLQAIREYILMNPARWSEDPFYFENDSGRLRR
ncbi:MAG: hypothetical protein OXG60_18985 [Chloroflexi bacterium]|nr:hypothetical protein [Chloroflexota bacterium]